MAVMFMNKNLAFMRWLITKTFKTDPDKMCTILNYVHLRKSRADERVDIIAHSCGNHFLWLLLFQKENNFTKRKYKCFMN